MQHCCALPMGHPSGVWRFESLVMPGAGDAITSHPEGNTPLLDRARWQVQFEDAGGEWRLHGDWHWPQQKNIDIQSVQNAA